MKHLTGLALLTLAACQPLTPPATTATAPDAEAAHTLAQGACGGGHSVEPFGRSPNPLSPEFATIANQPGMNRENLTTWLRDAHNYPAEMDFYLEGEEIDTLVTHILSLRRAGYEPPSQ